MQPAPTRHIDARSRVWAVSRVSMTIRYSVSRCIDLHQKDLS
jgi:hypothetical protein